MQSFFKIITMLFEAYDPDELLDIACSLVWCRPNCDPWRPS